MEVAARWIRDAMEQFTSASQQRRAELEGFLQERIVPAEKKRRQAKRLVTRARKTLSQDSEEAWDLLREAEAKDPHLSELEAAREEVRPGLRALWRRALRKAAAFSRAAR